MFNNNFQNSIHEEQLNKQFSKLTLLKAISLIKYLSIISESVLQCEILTTLVNIR